MARNSGKSRLLTLPPELRNQIYEGVVHSNKVVIHGKHVVSLNRSLVAVCRQTRSEFLPFVNEYITNYIPSQARDLELHVDGFKPRGPAKFLSTLKPADTDRHLAVVVHLTEAYVHCQTALVSHVSKWCALLEKNKLLRDTKVKHTVSIDWYCWSLVLVRQLTCRIQLDLLRNGDKWSILKTLEDCEQAREVEAALNLE